MSTRSREAARLAIAFSGRISGAVLTILIVRMVGVDETANPLYLALGVYTVTNGLMLSLLETNTVALWANRLAQRSSDLYLAGALFGVVVGATGLGGSFALAIPVHTMRAALPLIALLTLAAPLTGVYAVFLGMSVTQRSWVVPACGAWARVLVAGIVAEVLVGPMALTGVAVAVVIGDLARLSPMLRLARGTWPKGARPSRPLLRHAVVQVPSSLAGTSNPLIDRVVVSPAVAR